MTIAEGGGGGGAGGDGSGLGWFCVDSPPAPPPAGIGLSAGGGAASCDLTLAIMTSSSQGGGTHVTGSLITPQVRLIGPEGRRGLLVSGRMIGIAGFAMSMALLDDLSRALRRDEPSPGVPARLKSKTVRSADSPRNRAI